MKRVLFGGLAALGLVLTGFAHAQQASDYPKDAITMVVAFSPGGGTDTLARLVSDDLGKALGQSVVVENRPGAAGFVGWRSVASAKPDGYTLLFSENAIALNTALRRDRDFDPLTQLDAIVHLATAPLVLVVGKDVKANTLAELVELSKATPDKITFSSSGVGSVSHLTFEAMASSAGIEAEHVPYKGGGEALTAVAGGHVAATMTTAHVAKKMIDAGEVKGIAVTSAERSPVLPDLPTLAEAGLKSDVELVFWYGIFGPKGLPDNVKATINEAAQKVMADPAVAERLATVAVHPAHGSGDELGAKLEAEIKNWTAFLDKAGIKVQD